MIKYLEPGDLVLIRGGAEPVKPVSRPKDFYDEEEAQAATMSNAENAFSWREWFKDWLEKNK